MPGDGDLWVGKALQTHPVPAAAHQQGPQGTSARHSPSNCASLLVSPSSEVTGMAWRTFMLVSLQGKGAPGLGLAWQGDAHLVPGALPGHHLPIQLSCLDVAQPMGLTAAQQEEISLA